MINNQESRFINHSNNDNDDDNYELQLKQRKFAKLYIFFSILGIFAGVSASVCFFFVYKLVQAPVLALISAIIATFVCYIHIQFLRNMWQIWTYQLKYWNRLGIILQIISIILFIIYLVLGLYNKQRLTVTSYYIQCVWCFMCWKWSFALFHFTKKYLLMYNRYIPLANNEQN